MKIIDIFNLQRKTSYTVKEVLTKKDWGRSLFPFYNNLNVDWEMFDLYAQNIEAYKVTTELNDFHMIFMDKKPLILVNFLVAMGMSKMTEGNQNMGDSKKDHTKKDDEKKDHAKKDKNADKPAKKTNQDLPMTPIDPVNTATDEAFEVGRANRGGSKIDYASTFEDAYDQLNSILGSDGIKNLTGDTQKLMKQQMQLAESMKNIGPMIEGLGPMMKQAQELLGGMGDSKDGGMANIMEMAKKFTGSLPSK
jgi:hypothetical protein